MNKPKKKKSSAGIYVFTAAWIICSLVFPLYKIHGLVLSALISLSCGLLAGRLVSRVLNRELYKKTGASAQPQEAAVSYGTEVDAILAEGKRAIKEMGRLYSSIKSTEIRAKINELMRITDKIVQSATQDSSDVQQIRKFLDYYLPTTIKLLNAYDRMSDLGFEGENLSKSKRSIEDMLDTAIEAFKRQLDSLFEHQALDIETDIGVMNMMLAREGLAEDELDALIEKAELEHGKH